MEHKDHGPESPADPSGSQGAKNTRSQEQRVGTSEDETDRGTHNVDTTPPTPIEVATPMEVAGPSNDETEPPIRRAERRLSGAQRRKLAIAAARAKGETIRPRKPRTNRRPKAPQSSGTALEAPRPSGSVSVVTIAEAPKPSRGDNTKGAKKPGIGEPSTSKRTASELSTPSPARFPKKTRGEESQAIPSTSTGASYSQALTAPKMAISLANYPEGKLTEEQTKLLQKSITLEILNSQPGQGPQIAGSYSQGGLLFVTCANEQAKTWLGEKIPGLQPWEGAALKVDEARKVVKTVRVVTWIPTEFVGERTRDPAQLLQLLSVQNPDLRTQDWRVVNSLSERGGQTLVLAMDEDALKDLSKRGFRAYFGLTQLTFRVAKKPEGEC
jgi:Domain of unknown function (DUF4780)